MTSNSLLSNNSQSKREPESPLNILHDSGELDRIYKYNGDLMNEIINDLITGLLNPDPHKRLTIDLVVKHPWLII